MKSNDYALFSDFSLYAINSDAYSLVTIGEKGVTTGITEGNFKYTASENDVKEENSKPFQISIGVVDVLDTFVETSIDITGLKISRISTNANDIITNYSQPAKYP